MDEVGVVGADGVEGVLPYAGALADAVQVDECLLAVAAVVVGLVGGLGIVEIGEGQAVGEALAVGDAAGEVVVEHVQTLAGQVAVLRGIVRRRRLHVVAAVVEEAVLALAHGEPCAVEADGVVEAGLAVAVHGVGTAGRHLAGVAGAILPRGDVGAVVDGGRHDGCAVLAVLLIAGVGVADGQAVLHEEGIDQVLVHAQSVAAAILAHAGHAQVGVAVAVALRHGEGDLVVALAPLLDVHVVGGEEGVYASARSGLGVEGVAGALGLVDAEPAGLCGLDPLLVVVLGVEDLLALVVHVVGVPGVAVHQRAGGEEEHAGAHGEGHDAVDAAVLRRVVVDGGQGHGGLEHLAVAVVDDVVEARLAHHELREGEVGGSDVVGLEGDAAVVLGHLPPAVGAEELHLVLHVVNLALRQVVVGHGLHHIIKDVAVADVARHHVPEVAAPRGVDGPLPVDLRDDAAPVPLLPAHRGRHVVGEDLVAVGREGPLVGVVDDVVHVAEPRVHLVAVLEHHLGGELGVGLLVKVVAAGGERCAK